MAEKLGLPPVAAIPAQTQCPRCEEKATRVCGGCQNIMYCSPECQQTDWPVHKSLCKDFKDFEERPSANKCRVVAFLPGEAKPRFMWATVVDKGDWMTFDAQELFPTSQMYESKITIRNNAWTDTYLDYQLDVYFTKRAIDCYPAINQTVNNAAGGLIPTTAEYNFHGPVFAFCGRLLGRSEWDNEIVQAHDMDMRTYADLMTFLTYYCNTERFAALKGPKVLCVKVASEGDFRQGARPYEVVDVPRTHPIFIGKGVSSPISEV
jgi:hypothetical protein